MGQPRKAAENFELVDRMGKAGLAVLNTLGDLYVNEGMWELAGRAYRRALEAGRDQPMERPLRNVEALAQRGALPEARTLLAAVKERYQAAAEEADRKKILKVEARLAVAEGAGGEAVGVLEEIVALDPLDGDALLLLGAHYARNQDPDRAVFYYERAESLEGYEAEARVRHAQILVGRNQYRDAVGLLKRAQELKPRDDVARYLDQVERLARSQ
jgi:tetratricopeptide (TPR) repeat protein